MQPLISVLVPAYNAADYLATCIESIHNQSNDGLEIIIVNDGSTDGTGELCKVLTEKYDCIQAYHQPNGGPNAARQTALSHATGEYISFIDADDFVEAGLYEAVGRLLTAHPTTDILEFGYRKITSDGKVISEHTMSAADKYGMDCLSHYIKQNNVTNFLCNKVFRRELFNNVSFPAFYTSEDRCVLTQLYANAKETRTLPVIYYDYVQSQNSLSRSPFNPQKLDVVYADDFIDELLQHKAPSLRVYHACAACSHCAQLYAAAAGSTIDNKDKLLDFLKQRFKFYYMICRRSKEAFSNASYQRRWSVRLFACSPRMYQFLDKAAN